MNHTLVSQLLAAHVLGACEQAETLAMDAHLRQCRACAAEARPLRAAVDALDAVLALASLPPRLRGRLLAEASAFIQEPSSKMWAQHEPSDGRGVTRTEGADAPGGRSCRLLRQG